METALFLVDGVANTDSPSIGFCILLLLGSKYERAPVQLGFSRIARGWFKLPLCAFTSQHETFSPKTLRRTQAYKNPN